MNNNVLVSSCLLGKNCKYNGGNNNCDDLKKLIDKYNLIEICPEVLGGLPTPRHPSEIVSNKVMNKIGEDVTKQFILGANIALNIAKEYNVKYAILKANSPSCGFGCIYDGTFSGKITKGNGVTADLLYKNGVVILNENNFYELLK